MIRLATTADEDIVLQLIKHFHNSSPYSDYKVDDTKTRLLIKAFTDGPLQERFLLLLVDDQNLPVGFFMGGTTEYLLGYEKIAGEVGWWITPEHRNYRNMKEMHDAYDYWAKEVGARQQGIVSVDEKTNKLYKHLGYEIVETACRKDVK